MEKPLVQNEYLLQKFPGKGGWTYAEIPDVLPTKRTTFGWVKVKGKIDDFEFSGLKLTPMGLGRVFLPVKAEIRKKIKKQAGDTVQILLYPDESALEIPVEIIDCLNTEPEAYEKFISLPEGRQKEFLDWIYAAKTEDTKAERISITIDKVLQFQKP
ncbi:MAG: YdeI/OmpD-associated family protein [Adhaeribacter sp.]